MTHVAISPMEPPGLAMGKVPAELPVIDRAHLARMTYGDSNLERELLELFDRQATILLARMRDSEAAALAGLAHTLKGSAVGVGAVGVAEAAAAAESAAGLSQPERRAAIDCLAAAVDRVRPEIAALLKA
jgi:HPt (histidine-containing phosphotransfer) domain-containing protein